jgi:hypothetical protein
LSVAGVTIVAWARWFTAGSVDATKNALEPHNWPAVLNYYIRILALPAHFLSPSIPGALIFGILALVMSLWAVYVSVRSPWRDRLSVFVCLSLLVGHHLSAVMVALGRSGSAWGAEDPKYYYYSTVILVTTAALFWASGAVDRIRARAIGLATLTAVGVILVGGSTAALTRSRVFYKGVEAAGLAAAMGTADPQTIAPAIRGPDQQNLYKFAEKHRLNIFRWRLFLLLGRESARLRTHAGCTGSIEGQRSLAAWGGGSVSSVTGWAIDPGSTGRRDLGIAVANEEGAIVGLGLFVYMRPEMVRAHSGFTPASNAPLVGWKAFVRATTEGLRHTFFVVDQRRLTACRFADVDLKRDPDADVVAANAAFIGRMATIPIPAWRQRLALFQGR